MVAGQTIFAPSSGTQRSGVCVIRVSGPGCLQVFEKIVGGQCPPRQACLREFRDPMSDEAIDQCLVLWFPAPRSFTGEDVVELHVHGGRAVIDASLRVLGELSGFRLAEPGEFARHWILRAAQGIQKITPRATWFWVLLPKQKDLVCRGETLHIIIFQ